MMRKLGQLGMLASAAKMIQRQLATRKTAGAGAAPGGRGRSWQDAAQRFRRRAR